MNIQNLDKQKVRTAEIVADALSEELNLSGVSVRDRAYDVLIDACDCGCEEVAVRAKAFPNRGGDVNVAVEAVKKIAAYYGRFEDGRYLLSGAAIDIR